MQANTPVRTTQTLRERLEELTKILASCERELEAIAGTEVQGKPEEHASFDGTLMAAHRLLDFALDQARHIQHQIACISERL